MILSKLHVWKKQYGSLSQMLSRSGFCWNESANTIDVIDDQVWNDYVKFDSNARLMRYKSWPYFKDWTIIFGKDRAMGKSAEAPTDAINDISKQDKEAGDDSMGGDHIPQPAMHSNENDSENMSSLHGEGYMSNMQGEETSTSHQSRGKKKGNKRSRNDDLDGCIVDMMEDMTRTFAETKTCLGELAHRIGFEHDASTTRKKVLDALSPLCLGVEDKITVAKAVCNSPTDLDIFFGLNETEKGVMVRMILEGRYIG